MIIKLKKLTKNAIIPSNTSGIEAGYDLFAAKDDFLRPLERRLIPTDIALEIPEGYYGRICDRSGNALKLGLHIMAGCIDSSYRGNIGVLLYNVNGGVDEIIQITKGMKIAQIVFEKHEMVIFEDVEGGNLSSTVRGEKGYGSSDGKVTAKETTRLGEMIHHGPII